MPSKWVGLQDVEAAHREAPRTFSIPRSEQRAALQPGDLVKLIFEADQPSPTGVTAERMWVRVQERRSSRYLGVLDNTPSFIADLAAGAGVEFGPEHVAALHESTSGLGLPYGKWAIVSRRVVIEGAWPAELRREPAPGPEWSGWFILDGTEDAAFRSDQQNFRPVLVDDLVRQFRVLDSVLDEPVGSQWRWHADRWKYVRLEPAL